MAKKKLKDKFTGISEGTPLRKEWGGGCSHTNSVFYYATLYSRAYYKTEDDNYANFDGHQISTPRFESIDKLRKYMETTGIKVGSTITRTIPINDWEHKPYNRVVSMPVTDIEISAEYRNNWSTRMSIERITESETETNPDFDGDFNKVKKKLLKQQLQNMYIDSKRPETTGEDTVTEININPEELFQIFEIFGITK